MSRAERLPLHRHCHHGKAISLSVFARQARLPVDFQVIEKQGNLKQYREGQEASRSVTFCPFTARLYATGWQSVGGRRGGV